MSIWTRLVLFSAFNLTVAVAALSYMLAYDEEFLFSTRERAPWVVRLIAPWIGLPIEEETGDIDVAAIQTAPRNVSEIVGDTVKVAAKLHSGRVLLLDAGANDTEEQLFVQVAKKMNLDVSDPLVTAKLKVQRTDSVVEFLFVDEDEAVNLASKSDDDLRKSFGVKIPELPAIRNKEGLELALALCRMLERDIQVQLQLSEKYSKDATQYERTLQDIEQRKREIKNAMKELPSSLRSWLINR